MVAECVLGILEGRAIEKEHPKPSTATYPYVCFCRRPVVFSGRACRRIGLMHLTDIVQATAPAQK